MEILDYKAPPTNYKEYIKIVKDKAVLRRMLEISNEIVDKIYNMEGNVAKDILSYMESQVFQISDENITGDFVAISDVLIDTVQELENMATSRSIVQGIPTGFRDLDSIIGGFKPELLYPELGIEGFQVSHQMPQRQALRVNKSLYLVKLGQMKRVWRLIPENPTDGKYFYRGLDSPCKKPVSQGRCMRAKNQFFRDFRIPPHPVSRGTGFPTVFMDGFYLAY